MSTSLSGGRGASGNKIPPGYRSGRIQQQDADQQSLYKRLFGFTQPGSQLYQQAQGDQEAFAPQEALAQRDFQNFQGQLGSRFAELAPGAMSARRGSGFANAATQGSQDFALQLAGQRQQLQRQAFGDLMGLSSTLLQQRPTDQFLVKKEMPFWKQLALGAVGGGSNAISGLLGGLFGGGQRNQQQQQNQFQQTQF